MTYDDFLRCLEQKIQSCLQGRESVRRVRILKNNGVKLDGFSYYVEGHKERPTVYVNQYYEEEITQERLVQMAELVLKTLRECRLLDVQGVEQMMDFAAIRERIFCRLVSRERNEPLLMDIPWLPWLDLAIVFHFQVPECMMQRGTALIHTSHMNCWGVTLDELFRAAAENMAKVQIFLEPMETFLWTFGFEPLSNGMHVLSNQQKEYGAAVIIDPRVQRLCFRKLGESFYVLPSSVHELLLLPESLSAGRTELDRLIREVNDTCVGKEEYLSGHAYFYSGETETLV